MSVLHGAPQVPKGNGPSPTLPGTPCMKDSSSLSAGRRLGPDAINTTAQGC